MCVCRTSTECVAFCRTDFSARYPEALRVLSKWVSEGRIIRKYHIVEGLASAPEALSLLFAGTNTGKLFVRASLPPRCCRVDLQDLRVVHVSCPHAKY